MGGSTPYRYEWREAARATAMAQAGEHVATHAGVMYIAHHRFYIYAYMQYISFIICLSACACAQVIRRVPHPLLVCGVGLLILV